MLSKKELELRADRNVELKAQIDALKAEYDANTDEITKEMERRGVSELVVGNRILRYTVYEQSRFDSGKFKKAFPDMYASFQKIVTGRRFSVS